MANPSNSETDDNNNNNIVKNNPSNSFFDQESSNSETDNNNNNIVKNNESNKEEDSPAAAVPPPQSICKSSNLEAPIFPIALKFEDIVYKVKLLGSSPPKEKTILNNLTGTVSPGEILAMLGPSGSGKTTLLTALGGRLHTSLTGTGHLSGKITYNNQPYTSFIKRHSGFVAQDDILYPHLTVHETLHFTALLRLPRQTPLSTKSAQVERVIDELGLTHCRDSMVGGPLVRGISGGEKKRVSIGQEMLLNPSLLLLDEPTSGLDSTTAMRIMVMIKRLAKSGGRTIVTTIHQPSSRLYHMFDKVVVLSNGGCPIYYGNGGNFALEYFESIGFFSSDLVNVNPADVLLDLASGIGPVNYSKQSDDQLANFNAGQEKMKSVREALISAYNDKISPKLKTELCNFDSSSSSSSYKRTSDMINKRRTEAESAAGGGGRSEWNTSWRVQFTVLLKRGMKERRFEAFNKLRIFQVLSVAILGGLLWWRTPHSHIQDRIALLFFFTVFWGFYPLYNAVFTFPQERRTLIKERSSGMYRLSSYFLARTIGDLPLELALPTSFVLIIYWMAGLKPDPSTFLLSLLVVLYNVLVAQSLGLAIGAVLMDIKPATTLASVTTLVFLMAGGYYVQQIPRFIVWLKYLSYSYYCYRLLLGVQYDGDDLYECGKGVYCRVGDVPFVKSMGLTGLWVDVVVLTVMLIGYRFVAYLALQRVR